MVVGRSRGRLNAARSDKAPRPAITRQQSWWRVTIRSMVPLDAQQRRLLERLRKAGDQPVAFAELRAGGIDFPAAIVSELELNGYVIERVYDHGRLVGVRRLHPEPDKPHTPARAPAAAAPVGPIANRRARRDQRRRPVRAAYQTFTRHPRRISAVGERAPTRRPLIGQAGVASTAAGRGPRLLALVGGPTKDQPLPAVVRCRERRQDVAPVS
jgi:hypothetical protein